MRVFKASSHNMAKNSIQVAQKVFQHSWLVRKQALVAGKETRCNGKRTLPAIS